MKHYYGIRPEDVIKSDKPLFKAKIDVSELMGREHDVHFAFGGKKSSRRPMSEKLS